MDCDGTYDPKDIQRFLSHAQDYDQIIEAGQRKDRIIRKPEDVAQASVAGTHVITIPTANRK